MPAPALRPQHSETDGDVAPLFHNGWELLVLTDSAEPTKPPATIPKTLFVSFDSDNAQTLRGLGYFVREPSEYDVPIFTSYDELYVRYSSALVGDEGAADPDGTEADADLAIALQHLRFKAVEVFAPIMYVWDTTETILSREGPRRVEIHIRDPWLSAVLHALLDGRSSLRGTDGV